MADGDGGFGTGTLDALRILISKLERIEGKIETLPAMVERMNLIGTQVSRLEKWVRDSNKDAQAAYNHQQQAIMDVRLKLSEAVAGIASVSSDLQETKVHVISVAELARAADQKATAALDGHSNLSRRIGLVAESSRHVEVSESLKAVDARIETIEEEWGPWVKVTKWVLTTIGGVFLVAIAAAILWAVVQSGAGIP